MDKSLLLIGLVAVAIIGVLATLFFDTIFGGDVAAKRKAQFQSSKSKSDRDRGQDLNKRRQQIADSIKDLEKGNKKRSARTVENMIAQAGLKWTVNGFYIGSAIAGVVMTALAILMNFSLFVAAGALVAFGVGGPRWLLSFLAKRRMKKFLNEFPSAVDMIIRGVKAGLPIGQTIGIIAAEANEPVRSEFRQIVEAQAIGMTVSEAVDRLPDRVPLAETAFFAIVVNLQQKSGGNLSEALGNLSRVLRDRKKMRQKIQAMSSEAKASAGIIGSLPFIVTGLVYLTSRDYIMLLFTHTTGHIVLGVCAVWMAMGIFVMKQLINFDF